MLALYNLFKFAQVHYRIFAFAALALALVFAVYKINSWREDSKQLPKAIAYAEKLEREIEHVKQRHIEAAKITEKVSQEYENDLNKLNADMRRLRAKATSCVPIVHSPGKTTVSHATNVTDKPGAGNGVTSTALYDFAGSCEVDRIRAQTLRKFIVEVWKQNGYD